MQQVWHIFKKDVRYLRREIILLLALAVALYWLGAHGLRGDASDAFGTLVGVAGAYTIARLIHAEALPGENQFWITRPYRWQSLLAAKLLFIVVFINLPVFMAQAATLIVKGFPIPWIIPGLLWMQVLVLICVVFPLAVMAALTDGLAMFFGSILVMALIAFALFWLTMWSRFSTPAEMEWLRGSVAYVTLVLFVPPLLLLQYKLRRTGLGRVLAIGVAIFGVCAYSFVSWRALFPLQSRLSKQDVNVQVVRSTPDLVSGAGRGIPLGRQLRSTGVFEFGRDGNKLAFTLPVVVTGVPEGSEVQLDGYGAALETADGQTQLNVTGLSMYRNGMQLELATNRSGQRGPELPKSLRDNPHQPVTLRGSFYLTVFGNPQLRTITLRKEPTNILDGIQCYEGYLNNVLCQAPFRWPARMVSQRSGAGHSDLTHLISYSPFPATLDLAPIVWEGTAAYSEKELEENRHVTIEVQEPLAFVRRDVEVRDLHLDVK